MKAGLVAIAATLLWIVPTADAHRLDEFLQATTLAVEKDHVTLQMCLTPGVEVFHTVVADLDPNGDGVISAEVQGAYANQVLRDLSLRVDGSHLSLRLVDSTFPQIEALREGLGDILLIFRADVPQGGPDRRLILESRYQSGRAVYLVNCLSPRDPDLRITAQSRNYEQSF